MQKTYNNNMFLLNGIKFWIGKGQMDKKWTKAQLKERLSPEQYRVTQENGTEPPYRNEYYKCTKEGTYVCVVCDLPLFSSQHKYDSGCGWPAFWAELEGANIRKIKDTSYGMLRTQVRCSNCDSHLGHIFEDGPEDKTGVRYCINSASMSLNSK